MSLTARCYLGCTDDHCAVATSCIYQGNEIRAYESTDRVEQIEPDLSTRFYRRAARRARKLNGQRIFPSYRWAVVRDSGRYHVVAFQNYATPPDRPPATATPFVAPRLQEIGKKGRESG